jgi:hypothetical protein
MLNRNRLLLLLGALLLTFCIRVLTLQFMRAHLNDPGWFQVGSYATFSTESSDSSGSTIPRELISCNIRPHYQWR